MEKSASLETCGYHFFILITIYYSTWVHAGMSGLKLIITTLRNARNWVFLTVKMIAAVQGAAKAVLTVILCY